MVLSYSGYYTGLSSRILGFDSPQDRQVIAGSQGRGESHKLILEGSNPSSATSIIVLEQAWCMRLTVNQE